MQVQLQLVTGSNVSAQEAALSKWKMKREPVKLANVFKKNENDE